MHRLEPDRVWLAALDAAVDDALDRYVLGRLAAKRAANLEQKARAACRLTPVAAATRA